MPAGSPCATRAAVTSQHYRLVDFKRTKDGIPAMVERLEYDPNRTAHIALLLYRDGERRYIIAPRGMKAGDEVVIGRERADQAQATRCRCATSRWAPWCTASR